MSSLGETRHSTSTTLSFGVHDCIKTAAKFGGVAQTRIFAEDESSQISRIEAAETKEAAGDGVVKEAGVAAKGGEAVLDSLVKDAVETAGSKTSLTSGQGSC